VFHAPDSRHENIRFVWPGRKRNTESVSHSPGSRKAPFVLFGGVDIRIVKVRSDVMPVSEPFDDGCRTWSAADMEQKSGHG